MTSPTDQPTGERPKARLCTAQAAAGTLRQYWHCDLQTGHDGQHNAIAPNGAIVQKWGPVAERARIASPLPPRRVGE